MISKYLNISKKYISFKKYSTTTSKKFARCFTAEKDSKIDSLETFQSSYISSSDNVNTENGIKAHKPDGWITLDEFKQRRHNLAARIIQFFKQTLNASKQFESIHRHVLLIPASERLFMAGKVPYFYRQNADFRYFTGHLLPDAALLMDIEHDGTQTESFQLHSTLFVQDLNPREEVWEGKRISPDAAKDYYGVDNAYCLSDLTTCLDNYLKNKATSKNGSKNIALWYDFNKPTNKAIHPIMENMRKYAQENLKNEWIIQSPRYCIDEARLFKSPAEIVLMKRTCQIAATSIQDTISQVHNLNSEHQMASLVEHHCKMQGASHMAYPSVVASGDNCNVIHYSQSDDHKFNETNRERDLLLMDAGCEYGGYTSDVTRTWPLSGRFNNLPQRLVYEAVLDVQETLIHALQHNDSYDHGSSTWTLDSLYYEMKRLFLPHFMNLGLIDEKTSREAINVAISEACPHHVSHYLGMDVHDTPSISKSMPLLPGMIITLEPALYFPRFRDLRHLKVRNELKGIGVRIEDDILITEKNVPAKDGKNTRLLSCEVISSGCPKTIAELEDLMA